VPQVTLELATAKDAPLLANLLELYVHDVSDVFTQVELGADGRFGYAKLPLYFSEPERRFAFVIRHDGRVAGFVLATLGSPAAPEPDVYDVAEFFVLKRYRGARVGAAAAGELWRRLPGKWTVRVAERNIGALAFWSRTVTGFTRGTARERTLPGEPLAWRVFSLESSA
jgi:predicted acetyltransferase